MHHGAQIRRDHGQGIQNHPFGLVLALQEGLHHLQALDGVGALLAFGLPVLLLFGQDGDLFLQGGADGLQIQLLQQDLDGLGPDAGAEAAPLLRELGHQLPVGGVGDQGVFLGLGLLDVAGIDDDVGGEIEHLLQVPGAYVQQHAHAAGDALEIPDMADRGGQLDVAHALPAHLGAGHLHAAFVADLFLVAVFDALVFAAGALPVLHRAEDALAEQAPALGLQGAVVDGFRLGDFPVGPFADFRGRRHPDLDGVQVG